MKFPVLKDQMEVYLREFLFAALYGNKRWDSPPVALPPRKKDPVTTFQKTRWNTAAVWTQGEEKGLCFSRESNPGPLASNYL
jgi:hypothetical protein